MHTRLTTARLVVLCLTYAPLAACAASGSSDGTTAGATASPDTAPSGATATQTAPSPSASTWNAVGSGDTASGLWSPDAARLLVLEGSTNAPQAEQHVLLVTSDGSLERTIVGIAATWVDARSFIVWRSGHSYVESVSAASETAMDPPLPMVAVSNERGAIAVSEGVRNPHETFRVWTSDQTTATRPGEPVAWSADGTELAVWHFGAQGSGTGTPAVGTLEFLAWPTLSRISTSAQAVEATPAFFDSTGRYLAAPGPTVIEVQTGRTVSRPTDFAARVPKPSELVAWTAAGQIVVPSVDGGPASVFDPSGHFLQAIDGSFESASGSTDGTLVVLFALDPPAQGAAWLRRGSALPFALPDVGVEAVRVAGAGVLVRTRTATGESVLIAEVP